MAPPTVRWRLRADLDPDPPTTSTLTAHAPASTGAVRALLDAKGLRHTVARMTVLQALLEQRERGESASAAGLAQALQGSAGGVSLATLYKVFDSFERAGLIEATSKG